MPGKQDPRRNVAGPQSSNPHAKHVEDECTIADNITCAPQPAGLTALTDAPTVLMTRKDMDPGETQHRRVPSISHGTGASGNHGTKTVSRRKRSRTEEGPHKEAVEWAYNHVKSALQAREEAGKAADLHAGGDAAFVGVPVQPTKEDSKIESDPIEHSRYRPFKPDGDQDNPAHTGEPAWPHVSLVEPGIEQSTTAATGKDDDQSLIDLINRIKNDQSTFLDHVMNSIQAVDTAATIFKADLRARLQRRSNDLMRDALQELTILVTEELERVQRRNVDGLNQGSNPSC